MAYIILAFGGLYTLYWLLTFLFSMRSRGERSFFIPLLFILVFGGIGVFGFTKLSEAKSNPDKLTAALYQKLSLGMSPDDVMKSLQPLSPLPIGTYSKDRKKRYELSANKIKMPPSVLTRLGSGEYTAPRTEAFLAFSVEGEQSKVIAKPKPQEKTKEQKDEPDTFDNVLGHPATNSMNGVVGLKVRFFQEDVEGAREARKAYAEKESDLKEENKTPKEIAEAMEHLIIPAQKDKKHFSVVEGEDWNFSPDQSTGAIAKMLCTKIAEKSGGDLVCEYKYQEEYDKCKSACETGDASISYYKSVAEETCTESKSKDKNCVQNSCIDECVLLEVESFDNRFNIKVNPESTEFLGVLGNAWSAQVDSGANQAVRLRQSTSGMNVAFRGGADAADLMFWEENDILLDDDFLTNNRLLVAGFVNGKLVAVGQREIDLPAGAAEALEYKTEQ